MNTNFVQDAMHEVENLLKNAFTKAMQDGKLPEAEIPSFTVEIPAETTHGDFASNAAMVSARTFRNAPVKIANILKEEMDFSTARYIDRGLLISFPAYWQQKKTTVVPITARAKRL